MMSNDRVQWAAALRQKITNQRRRLHCNAVLAGIKYLNLSMQGFVYQFSCTGLAMRISGLKIEIRNLPRLNDAICRIGHKALNPDLCGELMELQVGSSGFALVIRTELEALFSIHA